MRKSKGFFGRFFSTHRAIKHQESPRKPMRVEELEARLLYSTDDPLSQSLQLASTYAFESSVVSLRQAEQTQRVLLIVDERVQNSQALIEAYKTTSSQSSFSVLHIESSDDAISKITGAMQSSTQPWSSVVIFSHASDGQLLLGNQEITESSLKDKSEQLARWSAHTTQGADLLLYGCDLASTEHGQSFVNQFARLTNLDVAASSDTTGTTVGNLENKESAGNWRLEYSSGETENIDFTVTNWQGTLATYTVTTNADSGAGSLRQAIIDANAAVGNHRIEFNLAVGQTTIAPNSALPSIGRAVVIDATTQAGYAGTPLVVLSGQNAGVANGLSFSGVTGATAGQVGVMGLNIQSFSNAAIEIASSNHTFVNANFIGTDETGQLSRANGVGINISASANVSVNGNVISGNTAEAMIVRGAATQFTLIEQNRIGTTSSGLGALGNGSDGIRLTQFLSDATVRLNTIAFNQGNGILADNSVSTRNEFTQNSIYSNGLLGVDLSTLANAGDGKTANDPLDADSGANNLMNAPEILRIGQSAGAAQALVRMNSQANWTITIEIFSSGLSDGDSARNYLGNASVTTDASGNWEGLISIPGLQVGDVLSFIAKNPFKSTSEISNRLQYGVAPSASNLSNTSYTEGALPLSIAPAIVLVSPQSPRLLSASVAITSNYQIGSDLLSYVDANGIAGSFNSTTGVLTLSSSNPTYGSTLADFQAALRSVTFVNSSESPSPALRTLDFSFFDGSLTGTRSLQLSVVAVNDAPIATLSGSANLINEQALTHGLFNQSVLSDVDATTFSGLTMRVSAATRDAGDELIFVNQNGIVGTWNAAQSELMLVGTASVSQYQAALRSIQYRNLLDQPLPSKEFELQVNDGSTLSAVVSRSATMVAANDEPEIIGSLSVTVPVSGSYTLTLADLSVSDVDTNLVNGFVVSVVEPAANFQFELLSAPSQSITSFTVNQVALGEVLLVRINNQLPTDFAVLRANDGSLNSPAQTLTIHTQGAISNVVVNASSTANFVEGASASALLTGVSVTNPDTLVFDGITVRINGGYAGTSDRMIYANGGNPQVSTTGQLNIAGTFNSAQLEAVLADLYFESSSENPSTIARTIQINISSAGQVVSSRLQTVTVTAVNDSTSINLLGSVNTYVEQGAPLSAFDLSTLGDLDTTLLTGLQVRITSASVQIGDLLNSNGLGPIVASWDSASSTLSLLGAATLNEYQSALRLITFESTQDAPSTGRVFEVRVNDGSGYGGWASTALTITPVNDAPVIGGSRLLTPLEGQSFTLSSLVLSAADPDLPTASSLVFNVTAAPSYGRLELNTNPGVAITSFSQADILAGRVLYVHLGSENFNDEFRVTLTDGNVLAGGPLGVALTVNAIAIDDPVLAVSSSSPISYTENASAIAVLADLVLSDPDSTQMSGATIRISAGFQVSRDVLNIVTQGGISGSFDSQTGIYVLSGNASLATYQSVLRSLTYVNTGDDPSANVRTITVELLQDNVIRATLDKTINVLPVNDSPVTGIPTSLVVVQGSTIVLPLSFIAITDVDSALLALQISITTPPNFGQFELVSNPNVAILNFTLDQINSGQVLYRQLGALQPSDSFVLSVTDALLTVTDIVRTINITANSNPIVTVGAGSTTYTENASATAIAPLATITDAGSTSLTGATIQIATGYVQGQDLLVFVDQSGITSTFNSATGTLTLTGVASLADYQTAVRSVAYANTSDSPSTTARSIVFTVSSSTVTSASVSRTLTVTAVNDLPVLVVAGSTSWVVNEGARLNISALMLDLSDADHSASQLVYTVSTSPSRGRLELSTNAGVAITFFTQANVNAGIVRYVHNGTETPLTDSFQLRFSDGVAALSTPRTINLTITPVDDPATVSVAGSINIYSENAAAITPLNQTTLTDPDSSVLYGARIAISSGTRETSTDILSFVNQNGITGTWSASTSTLVLSGSASLSNYQTAIRSITYRSTSESPGPSKTFQVALQNSVAVAYGNTSSRTITVVSINDTPVVSGTGLLAVNEGAVVTLATSVLNGTDVDTPAANLTYSITNLPTQGRLELSTAPGVAITSFSQLDLAAARVIYVHNAGEQSTDTFTVVLSDGTASASARVIAISVLPVDDPTQLTTALALGFTEGGAQSVLFPSIAIADPDNAQLDRAVLRASSQWSAGHDQLVWTPEAGLIVAYDAGPGVLTISGSASLAAYERILGSLRFSNVSEDPTETTRRFILELERGGVVVASVGQDITVEAINDAPQLDISQLSFTVDEDATLEFVGTGRVQIIDPDAGNGYLGLSIAVTNGVIDFSALADFTDISILSGDRGTGSVELAGSLADLNALLEHLVFIPNDHYFGPAVIVMTVDDYGNTGSGGSLSDTVTLNIDVHSINDAPQIDQNLLGLVVNEGGSQVIDQRHVLFSDVEQSLSTITYRITAAPSVGRIEFVDQPGSPIDSFTYADLIAQRVQYVHNGSQSDSDFFLIQASDGIDWSDDVRIEIGIAGVNSAPTISYPTNALQGVEDQPFVFTGSHRIQISDPDAGASLITVSLSSNIGYLTLSTVSNLSFIQGTGTFDASMVIRGSLAAINAALDGMQLEAETDYFGAVNLLIAVDDEGNNGTGGPLRANAAVSVDFASVNDAPSWYQIDTIEVNEGSSVPLSIAQFDFYDVDSPLSALQFTIVSGPSNGQFYDRLGNQISSFTYTQLAAGDITYVHNGAESDSDSFSLVVSDGLSSSAPETVWIWVNPVNDAPRLTLPISTVVGVDEQQNSSPLFGSISISDADDNAMITGATVAITSGYQVNQEHLTFTPIGGITGVWDSAAGVLRFVGDASASAYESIIRSVRFIHTSDQPSSLTRAITATVSDYDDDSNSVSRLLTIVRQNDAPTLATSDSLIAFNEDTDLAFSTSGSHHIQIGDPDSTSSFMRLSLQSTNSRFWFYSTTGLTIESGLLTNSDSVVLTGSQADINLALNSLIVRADQDFSGSALLRVTVSDEPTVGAMEAIEVSEDIVLDVLAVLDPLIVVNQPNTLAYVEGSGNLRVAQSLSIDDVEQIALSGAVITLNSAAVEPGFLTIGNNPYISSVWDSNSRVLTLVGEASVAEYETLLRTLVYSNSSLAVDSHTSTIQLELIRESNRYQSTLAQIDFNAVETPPTLSNVGVSSFTEGQSATLPWLSAILEDQDSANLSGITIRFTQGYQLGADVLDSNRFSGISTSWNAATGTLTATGLESVAVYQSWLRSVSFSNSSDLPTAVDRVLSVRIVDSTGAAFSRNARITVTSVNDTPTLTISGSQIALEDSRVLLSDSSVLRVVAADPDAATNSMALTLVVDRGTLQIAQSGLGATLSSDAKTLSFTGTMTQLTELLTLTHFVSETDSISPVSFTVSLTDSLGARTTNTATLTYIPVNDAPVLQSAASSAEWVIGNPARVLSDSMVVTDVDSNVLSSATIRIATNYHQGDQLLTVLPTGFSQTWDAQSGVLQIVGSGSAAQYQAVLRSLSFSSTSTVVADRVITMIVSDSGNATALATTNLSVKASTTNPVNPNPVGPVNPTPIDNPLSQTPVTPTSPVVNPAPAPIAAPFATAVSNTGVQTANGTSENSPVVIPLASGLSSANATQSVETQASRESAINALGTSRKGIGIESIFSANSASDQLTDSLAASRIQSGALVANDSVGGLRNLQSGLGVITLRVNSENESSESSVNEVRLQRADLRAERDLSTTESTRLNLANGANAGFGGAGQRRSDSLLLQDRSQEVVIDVSKSDQLRVDVLSLPVQGGGVVVSAVVLWWITRAGGLLTALMATMPSWQNFDPLPVLGATDGRDEDDESEVEPEDKVFADADS